MTTPPLDLPALHPSLADAVARGDAAYGAGGDAEAVALAAAAPLLDRLEAAEFEARRDGALLSVANGHVTALRKAREEARVRVTAAEAAISRVEALCQDTDGNWLDPEDECINVGGILQAVRGVGCRTAPGIVFNTNQPPYQTLAAEPLVSDTHTPETETTP